MKSAVGSPPVIPNEAVCIEKLRSIGQENLLHHWTRLTHTQQVQLCHHIDKIDLLLLARQRDALKKVNQSSHTSYQPLKDYVIAGDPTNCAVGQQQVKRGKSALVVLAGGQGTRVQSHGPKGCFTITPIKRKTLFQLLAEKVKAASVQASYQLDMALMTSPLNHRETEQFFIQHAYFGLHPDQIHFFQQEMLPLLDFSENLFLEGTDKIACGPNGNGGVFRCLQASGIWEKWHRKGVEQVNVIPIDSPLADPFDLECLGVQARTNCDIVIKTALRSHPHENVGVMVESDGKPAVIEYFEMKQEDRSAYDSDGQLKYRLANLGLYTVSMAAIKRLSEQQLPLHVAKKQVKNVDEHVNKGGAVTHAWKFEEFIFDILPFTSSHCTILYPREKCFAPLKNLYGKDSIESVRKALLINDRHVFFYITGSQPPADAVFELSPQFYYPTEELIKKWKGKPFPKEEYIHE